MDEFRIEKKPQVYPLRYIKDFFSILKSSSDQRSRFVTGRGFAWLPQVKIAQYNCKRFSLERNVNSTSEIKDDEEGGDVSGAGAITREIM